jgi:hypothetical protein
MTAYDRPLYAHEGRYCISARSVMYALTTFSVGVGMVNVAAGSQYLPKTREAVSWSAEADSPQLYEMELERDDSTSSDTAELEQMHDCSDVTSSWSSQLSMVCTSITHERAPVTHGGYV